MSHYVINVSKLGQHFFATAPHSCQSTFKTQQVYDKLKEVFPLEQDYMLTVSYVQTIGQDVTCDFREKRERHPDVIPHRSPL